MSKDAMRKIVGRLGRISFVCMMAGVFLCGAAHAQTTEDATLSKYGSHAEKVRELRKSLEKDPNNIDLLMELGEVYGWEEDLEGAVQVYERVLENNLDHLEAKRKLADFYSWVDKPDKSARMIEDVLKKEPDNLEMMAKLGTRYIGTERHTEAEALFKKVLEKDPQNMRAKRGLAELNSARSQHNEAIRAYKEILSVATTQEQRLEAYDSIANNYYYAQEYGKAKEFAQEALRLDPADKDAKRRLRAIEEYYKPTVFSEFRYEDYKGSVELQFLDVGWIQPTESGITATGVYRNYRRFDQDDKSVERYGYDSGALALSKYLGEGLTVSVGGELKFYTTDAAGFDYYLQAVKDFHPGLSGDFRYEKQREDSDVDRLLQHVDSHRISGTIYHDFNDWFSLHTNIGGRYYTQGDAFDDNFRISGYVSPVFHIIKRAPRLDAYYNYYRIFTFKKDDNADDPAQRFEYFAPRVFQNHSVTLYLQHDITKQLEAEVSDTVSWIDEPGFRYVQNTILVELAYKISEGHRVGVRYISTHHVHNGSETEFKNNEWRAQYSYRF